MRTSSLFALAASLSTALAVSQGFNYGSLNSDGSNRYQADFQREFKLAKELPGISGFNSARLYTMIQAGSSTNEPIQAIPAAIAESTTLLLGLWASAGDGFFSAEITALKTAMAQWGSSFTNLVVGISVGNEDLYRISPTGIAAESGYGAEPETVARYITQLREALKGTPLAASPIGHVDTWTAWVNGSNQAVIDAVDWVGVDAYPYFQNSQSNAINSGKSLFEDALSATQAAVGGKELWITETGWPVSGKTQNLAIPNPENAKTYWNDVGCPRFGKVNTWWFTLQDATPVVPNPSFGIVGNDGKPLFDLSCNAAPPSSTTTTTSSSASPPASASSQPSSVSSSTQSNPPASAGDGLSPSQGGGIAVPSSGTGASGPYPTSGDLSSSAGPSVVTKTTVVQGTGNAASTSSTPTTSSTGSIISGGAASTLSGSLVGAMGAALAVIMAL